MSWTTRLIQHASKSGPVEMPGYLQEITDTIPGGESLTQTVLYIQSNELGNTLGLEPLDKDNVVILGTVEEIRTPVAQVAEQAK